MKEWQPGTQVSRGSNVSRSCVCYTRNSKKRNGIVKKQIIKLNYLEELYCYSFFVLARLKHPPVQLLSFIFHCYVIQSFFERS